MRAMTGPAKVKKRTPMMTRVVAVGLSEKSLLASTFECSVGSALTLAAR